MRVFVGYGSVYFGQRIIRSIMQLADANLVGQSREPEEIVTLVREQEAELVILDTSLSGGKGLEVLRTLKRLPLPPVVIVLTTFWNEMYMRLYYEAGADYFFHAADEHEKVHEVIEHLVPDARPLHHHIHGM
jgi:DNA-binding NarL/FixJ family response regulator